MIQLLGGVATYTMCGNLQDDVKVRQLFSLTSQSYSDTNLGERNVCHGPYLLYLFIYFKYFIYFISFRVLSSLRFYCTKYAVLLEA